MIDLLTNPLHALPELVLRIPALLLAVTFHEVAHGWVADRLGDPTARQAGRLTLNPLPHIDPIGALAFVLMGFGWAKPVPVNPSNFRHPVRDNVWVAAAGPVANVLVATASLIGFVLVAQVGPSAFWSRPIEGVLARSYSFNLILAIFNLFPLPPLDGSHVLKGFLPRRQLIAFERLEPMGPFLLILLVVSGAMGAVLFPVYALVDSQIRSLFTWIL